MPPSLARCLLLLLVALPQSAASEPSAWTWERLAPIVGARLDSMLGVADGAPDAADISPQIAAALDEAIEATLPRVSLQLGRAQTAPGTASPGAHLLEHERSARLLRAAVAAALASRGVTCADCAPPARPVRDVTMVELLPYVATSTYVGTDDMEAPLTRPAFHVCAGGIDSAMLPDDELGEVALAAMMTLVQDEDGLVPLLREHVRRARADRPKGDARTITDLYRWRVAADKAILDALRPALHAEAGAAGLRCVDCRVHPAALEAPGLP